MKLHFEPDLDYQHAAMEAVCSLFQGQEICRSEFTVSKETRFGAETLEGLDTTLGVGNKLKLLDDEIHTNLKDIQLHNGLRPSETLASGDFSVEMETGTGKTYVYLRTIFELNRRYGFTKFVIVVPSVAIKEGVYKSLQITEEHFRSLYANTPYEYFLYDSAKLGQVRNFATSPNIQVMVVTVGAINKKDVNNLYKDSEKTGGEKPIDLIKATHPILIVDEPQSVDGGLQGQGKQALGAMNPLCTLRYSATHADKHHMVYRLDAVDAYERKLVKQIEVASGLIEGDHNTAYIRILDVKAQKGAISALVELDIQQGQSVVRKQVRVEDGDDLEQVTGRAIYHDCRIGEIRAAKGQELVEIRTPGSERWLEVGKAMGGVSEDSIQQQMIRRTIQEHLDKELRLNPMGIKVLSLFFIDHVENYRQYDKAGNPMKGTYAKLFEAEYRRAIKLPKYAALLKEQDPEGLATEAHEGYFSIDKKGAWSDTQENNQSNRDNAERAYNLIMKDKERLLSFETPLKFIFSHSALREGWDSPNVFQICALRDMNSERERRQTIGRGLRLCVNQLGERIRGFDVNTLTVVAMESYQDFAENLQKEIEKDTGIRFGLVEKHQFAGIPVLDEQGQAKPLGVEKSQAIWDHLKDQGFVDTKGKVQDSLRQALKDGTVSLPEEFTPHLPQVLDALRKVAGKLDIKNADERRTVRTRQAILQGAEFKALWDRIKHKTTYRVQFNNEALIDACIKAIGEAPPIPKTRMTWHRANLSIGKGGVDAVEKEVSGPVFLDEQDIELPDILTELQDRTQLTRRSIAKILQGSGRLKDFKRNPQAFIEIATEAINACKRHALVDDIRYVRLGDEEYYAQELFEKEELTGYLKNMVEVHRSVHEYVVYDSAGIEKTFAEDLEKNEAVKVYAKLPGWFKVPTPLGTYNPDWAVLIEQNGEERLYFVVETKGSLLSSDLRQKESAKIECGKKHFKALEGEENPAKFIVARTVQDVMSHLHG
jgi:type III restriction enzyme